MNLFTVVIKNITRKCLTENPDYTEFQCREWFYEKSYKYKNSKLFHEIFPAVYKAVRCEIETAEHNQSE